MRVFWCGQAHSNFRGGVWHPYLRYTSTVVSMRTCRGGLGGQWWAMMQQFTRGRYFFVLHVSAVNTIIVFRSLPLIDTQPRGALQFTSELLNEVNERDAVIEEREARVSKSQAEDRCVIDVIIFSLLGFGKHALDMRVIVVQNNACL